MAFFQLPPETLKEIFNHLGPSFFRQDVGRLTVSKQWFEFALPAALESIKLSEEKLRGLIFSLEGTGTSPLVNNLKSLELVLERDKCTNYCCQHRHSILLDFSKYCIPSLLIGSALEEPRLAEEPSREVEEKRPREVEEKVEEEPREDPKQVLDRDLQQLANVTQQSRKLRSIRISASRPEDTQPSQPELLSLTTIQSLFSTESLRLLVLDLPATLDVPSGELGTGCHLCPAISALLNTLETLHLRMRNICPEVLGSESTNVNLHLSEVIVNLSLREKTSASHSSRCRSSNRNLLELKSDMERSAQGLAARMSSPKKFRILTHTLPSFEVHSLDVLTGTTMVLDEDMQWDEDGEVLEDSEYETSESEISSLSN